jgi:hypothetical protein
MPLWCCFAYGNKVKKVMLLRIDVGCPLYIGVEDLSHFQSGRSNNCINKCLPTGASCTTWPVSSKYPPSSLDVPPSIGHRLSTSLFLPVLFTFHVTLDMPLCPWCTDLSRPPHYLSRSSIAIHKLSWEYRHG